MKVETSGVCHTDLHAAHGDWPVKPQPPFVPGHEGYGTVVALGEGVDDLRSATRSATPGCGRRAAAASTAAPAGRRCARASRTAATASTAASAPTCWSTPPTAPDPGQRRPAGGGYILCAGVTVYKGLKVTDTRPGQWVAISGIGGLGHIAVQYARAMGLRVVAIDVDDSKLALATRLGAEVVVNARTSDVVAEVQKATGGVHGVLVTAVHPQAFGQAIGSPSRRHHRLQRPAARRPGTHFRHRAQGLTIRGSIVGTRQDMAEALGFYARGLIHPLVASAGLDEINDVFDRMERGQIDGRIVIDYRKG